MKPFHKATTGIVYTSVTKHICVVTVIYQASYKLQFHVNTYFFTRIYKTIMLNLNLKNYVWKNKIDIDDHPLLKQYIKNSRKPAKQKCLTTKVARRGE